MKDRILATVFSTGVAGVTLAVMYGVVYVTVLGSGKLCHTAYKKIKENKIKKANKVC